MRTSAKMLFSRVAIIAEHLKRWVNRIFIFYDPLINTTDKLFSMIIATTVDMVKT